MIDPLIEQRFKELPPKYQNFVTGEFAVEAAYVFGSSLALTEEQLVIFENGIIFLLLFIFTKDDLVTYLELNTALTKEVIEPVVAAIIKSLPDYAEPLRRELDVVIPKSLTQQLQAEISATEHDLESIRGLRTMAHDMKEAKVHPITPHATHEVVHQSSQADILKIPTVPLASNPSTTWGSDR